MSGLVSANYRELAPKEIQRVASECTLAWQDPRIPQRQYEIVKPELESYRQGGPSAPFDALGRCLRRLPIAYNNSRTSLLDVGASGGYYSEILNVLGFQYRYTAIDFSPAFKELAETLYPGIGFDIGDARRLPYEDDSFDIVLNGACMMHNLDYETILTETIRVSKQFIILHRTPVFSKKPTTFYEKEAYGIRCLEIHFNEADLCELFRILGLTLLAATDVFWNEGFGHRDYVLEKLRIEPYCSNPNV